MRIRELFVEGPGPLDEPLRYELGAGHLVVHPDEPILPCLAALLYGAEPPLGYMGGLRAELEEGDARRSVERQFGMMEEGQPLFPGGGFWHLRRTPRPLVISDSEREELRAALPRLEAEMRAQEELERLDSDLQGHQHELSVVEARLEERERAAAAFRAAEERAEAYRKVALPPDLDERIAAFERERTRLEEKAARLREESEKEAKREAESQVDLRRDLRLLGGTGAGLLFLLLALLTPWKGLAILSIPSFGVSAALLLTAISSLQQREEAGRRRALLEERLAEAEKERAAQSRDFEVLLEATQTASLEELQAWKQRAREVEEEARQAAEALAVLDAREEIRTAAERRAQLLAAIDAGEKKIAELAAGSFRTSAELQYEIAKIREKLEGGGAPEDDSGAFLDAACRALGCDRAELLQGVGKRASQLLSALTEKRWERVGWGASGGMALKGASGVARFTNLEYEEREAAKAALLFAAAEMAAKREGVILLLDGPFDELASPYQARLAQALRWLGGQGVQILHRTGAEVFRRAATALEAA